MPLTIRRRLVDRVRQWRKIAYVLCAALVVLASAVVFLSVSAPSSSIEVASGSTFFDPDRALRTAEAMDLYEDCYLGSEDAAGVINWLVEKFTIPPMALPEDSVVVDEFKAPLGDGEETFRNVGVVLQ